MRPTANLRSSPPPDGKSLLLRYANLISGGKPTGISAIMRIASGGDGSFRMSLELKNGSPNQIPQVFFGGSRA